MAKKRAAFGKRKSTKKATPVPKAVDSAADDQQPAGLPAPPTRGRKKPAKKLAAHPHWQAGDQAEAADAPLHLARCPECPIGVRFRSSASGTGFIVVEPIGAEIDTTFGIGPSGLPLCPNGHGEMALADEGLPAAEAIAQTAAKLADATQAQLFDTAKPFNLDGAWAEVVSKRHEIRDLEEAHKRDAATARESKKTLDESRETLELMITRFEERRLQVEKDAQARADAADSDHTLVSRLGAVGLAFDVASVRALSPEFKHEVHAWLLDAEQHPDERARWMELPLPQGLVGAQATAPEPVSDPSLSPVPAEVEDDDPAFDASLDDNVFEAPL